MKKLLTISSNELEKQYQLKVNENNGDIIIENLKDINDRYYFCTQLNQNFKVLHTINELSSTYGGSSGIVTCENKESMQWFKTIKKNCEQLYDMEFKDIQKIELLKA